MNSDCCQYDAYKECAYKKCYNHRSGKKYLFLFDLKKSPKRRKNALKKSTTIYELFVL